MRKIIAVDFDGCLVESQWPEIGAPRWDVIDAVREERKKGAALILWTCRSGRYLDEAVDFCRKVGLLFDAVNDNLPEVVDLYGGSNCRKIVAEDYWDDHAVRTPAPEVVSASYAAEMLDYMLGDCPCNYSPTDEWLPQICPHCEGNDCPEPKDNACPNPEGRLECWLQFIRNFHNREVKA